MSVVALGSFHGSPGSTTLALALAAVWDRAGHAAMVVEADPDGGVLAARLGLGHHPCLTDLAVRTRAGLSATDVSESAQVGPGGQPIVVAHPSSDQCHATLRSSADRLAQAFSLLTESDVLVDVGRLRPGSPAMALTERAEVVVVVLRPRLEDVDVAAHRLSALGRTGDVALVLAGAEPYGAADVEAALDVPVIGVVPVDHRGAAALGTGGRLSARLPVLRAARTVAAGLATRLEVRSLDVGPVEVAHVGDVAEVAR